MRSKLLFLVLMVGLSLPAWGATVRVKANGTPLRARASADSEIVARLDLGTVLELVDVGRDWYKVREPRTRKEGFVPATLVDLVPGEVSSSTGRAGDGRPVAPGAQAPATKGRPAVRAPRVPPKPGEWRDGGFVGVNGLFQAKGTAFGYSFSPEEFAYAEEAHINTHHPLDAGPAFDAVAGWRVRGNLALGGAVSAFSKTSDVAVDGTVPHPLYLNRDRAVTGAFGSPRTEVGLHLQATYVVPTGRRVFVSLAGGPSLLHVKQAVADGINLSTVYPYDTTALTGARTTTVAKTGVGFNVGADVSYYLTRTLGVGGMVRFTRATLDLPTPHGRVSTTAGGLQAGIGLRVRLQSAAPKTPAKPKPPITTRPRKQA